MTVETIRLFKGATELSFDDCILTKSNDTIVDEAKASIQAETTVIINSTIDFKRADGSTTIFSGQVNEINKFSTWKLKILTRGYELNNIKVENVFVSTTPEAIVQDIIDNYTTNLTYASTTVSGFTIIKYKADKYAIDVIKDMMDLLNWQIRIDENANVYFEPEGSINNGITWINGTNFSITEWNRNTSSLINQIKVKCSNVTNRTQQSETGDTSTIWTLDYKPVGIVRITLDGTELLPTAYDVDAENKTVTFNNGPGVGVIIIFDYAFDLPIVVAAQNDESIVLYGERYKYISRPEIYTFEEARTYAAKFLNIYSIPAVKAKGIEGFINFSRAPGEIITLIDTARGEEEILIIKRITIDISKGTTEYELGSSDFVFLDWQAEVQNRIKKLEKQISSEDVITIARNFYHNMGVTLTATQTWEYNSPVDSFILGHHTLGRLRSSLNSEIDCSDNNNHGIWSGVVLPAELKAYWRLNESGTTNPQDVSGYGHHLTLTTGGTYISGKLNNAIDMARTGTCAVVAGTSDFAFGTEIFTIAYWVNSTLPNPAFSGAWFMVNANALLTAGGWSAYISNAGVMGFIAAGSNLLSTGTGYTDGGWHRVVFVREGTGADQFRIYIDGSLDSSHTCSDDFHLTPTNFNLNSPDGNWYLDGSLDDVRIYKGLSWNSSDVTADWNSGNGKEIGDGSQYGTNGWRLSYGAFNDGDRIITVNDSATLDLTTDISISLAIKYTTLPNSIQGIISKFSAPDGYGIRTTADNKVEMFYGTTGSPTVITSVTALTINVWYHFIFIKSGTNTYVYLNGVLNNSGTDGQSTIGTNAVDLYVGFIYGGNYFSGYVDEIKIYNKALDSTRVSNIYNKFFELENCICYLSMDNPRLGNRETARTAIA